MWEMGTIKTDGKIVCNYDRGWGIKPNTEEVKEAVRILLKKYN